MKDTGLLILRLGFGGMMLPHGYSKLLKLFSGGEIHFYNFLGIGETFSLILAVIAEFLCAIMIIIGVNTRLAAIPLAVSMAAAAFMVHAGDPWAKKEMAIIYLIGYLAIAFLGSGKYSLDGLKSN